MKTHARLSPSSASRWQACPGSVNLSEQAPPSDSSEFADEGTAAHALLEKCLVEALEPSDFLGKTIEGFLVTDEMVSGVKLATDYVFRKRNEVGGVLEVETKLDLTKIHPDIFGTLDISIYKKGKRLVIIDFKYGVTRVEVQDNRQLLVYAVGAALKSNFDVEEIELSIIQPRAPHNDGPIRSWVIGREYLLSWVPILLEAANLTEKKNAPLYRGDHCGYCPAKGICPKQKDAMEQALTISADSEITLPPLTSLTDEQMARIIEHQSEIEDFLSEVKRAALHRLKNGEKIDGLKLVAGRGSRAWVDEEKAKEFLTGKISEDLAYTRKFISPAQAEKLVKGIDHLWVKIEGSETVTHSSDKRKEIQPLAGTLILNKGVKNA